MITITLIIKNNDNNNNDNEYKDLEIEIKKTLKLKSTTVPVVIGALRLVKKGTENYITKIPGNRASEDCPPWDCSHTQDLTVQQVIHKTYDCPKFME